MQGPGVSDQRRLVIDVIAGTSAGGLNGTLLANVIAHNTTLDPAPESDGEDRTTTMLSVSHGCVPSGATSALSVTGS